MKFKKTALVLGLAAVLGAASCVRSTAAEEFIAAERLATLHLMADPGPAGHLGALLEKSIMAYDRLKDYRAVFIKTERANGRLGPKEEIYFKFEKPFKIFMGWLNTSKKGLQVFYHRGHHEGKLAIHKPGMMLGLAPVVFLDQNSPWVREGSVSYNIEDAGIGSFLADFTKAVLRANKRNQLKVESRGMIETEGLSGEKVEVTFVGSKEQDDYFAYRVGVLFDRPSGLPVLMELFDWNDQPMGIYEYRQLKIDVGPEDQDFMALINRRLLRFYRDPADKNSHPPSRNVSSR